MVKGPGPCGCGLKTSELEARATSEWEEKQVRRAMSTSRSSKLPALAQTLTNRSQGLAEEQDFVARDLPDRAVVLAAASNRRKHVRMLRGPRARVAARPRRFRDLRILHFAYHRPRALHRPNSSATDRLGV